MQIDNLSHGKSGNYWPTHAAGHHSRRTTNGPETAPSLSPKPNPEYIPGLRSIQFVWRKDYNTPQTVF